MDYIREYVRKTLLKLVSNKFTNKYSGKFLKFKTAFEKGEDDLPFTFIHKCALAFDVEITDLLEGQSAKLSTYNVTRRGKGQTTANEEGILAFGPYSPDGFFGLGNYSKYDAVLAMYHDQGLTPFKALAFEDGVNFTAGLPIVRTSPDHGTAYEMAGRDLADPRSMMAAIYTAIDIYNKREDYDDLVENRMTIKMPDTEIKPRGGRIIE